MKISAQEVNKLRKATGAGMMDCKKALQEAEGDMEKAIDILRKKGQKVAAKRADREAGEGVVLAKVSDDKTFAASVMINCETDFVAKNQDFIDFVKSITDLAVTNKAKDKDELNALMLDGRTVADLITEKTGVIGEKIQLGNYQIVEGGSVHAYIHNGNRIASIVAFNKAGDFDEAGKDVAMQIAAMDPLVLSYKEFTPEFLTAETEARIAAIEKDNIELARLGKTLKHIPKYISKAQLPDEVIEKAKKDIIEELKAEGKPEKIWDRVIPGKLQRFIDDNTTADKELCLLDQDFIKDSKITVADYLKSIDPELTVVAFKRLALAV